VRIVNSRILTVGGERVVNPGRPIPRSLFSHGITDDWYATSRRSPWCPRSAAATGAVLVARNAAFDLTFLNPPPVLPFGRVVVRSARPSLPTEADHSLDAVAYARLDWRSSIGTARSVMLTAAAILLRCWIARARHHSPRPAHRRNRHGGATASASTRV
jgi:DNA polymerase III epsilon subunit-like protein